MSYEYTIQDKYLMYLATKGAYEIYGHSGTIDERIEQEMKVITENKFTDYILMVYDIHDFCKSPSRVFAFCAMNGITPPPDGIVPIGPGRGSVGGSMVCYVIGIHECDPIRFGLYFERFLNPERISYPDIDFDLSQRYRHIALKYIAGKYGTDKVAQIITYSTLSVKSVIEEVLKSAQVPLSAIASVKETVPEEPTIRISDMIENEKFMKAMQALVFPNVKITVNATNINKIKSTANFSNEDRILLKALVDGQISTVDVTIQSTWDYDMAIGIMQRLEKLNKHESVHAGGVVVSPRTLRDNIPLMRKSGTGVLACQYDMNDLERLGYLKIDALGLRTVDVNHDAERMVRQWYDKDFDIRKIPLDDMKAIDLMRNSDTVGIFQVESSGFTQMMHEIFKAETFETYMGDVEIEDFMWISAGLAMYRPGPLNAVIEGKTMVQHLIDRKGGREAVTYLFDEEVEYLSETYGVLVYQEQVQRRVRQMTGCSMGRADVLRKAMGKKNPVLMKSEMDWFEEASLAYTFTEKELTDAQKQGIVARAREEITKFARYGFNKAHTVEYAFICYRNSYLKAHYPVAFYTALLNSEIDNGKRQAVIIRDMMSHNINLLPPLVTMSERDFTMTSPDTIRFGLAAIKGLGEKGVDIIIADRDMYGQFTCVEDFRIRVPGGLCNVNVMTNLAKAGAFDDVLDKSVIKMKNRATLVASMKDINDVINKACRKKGKNKPAPTPKEVMSRFRSGMAVYPVTEDEEDLIVYATWEKEVLNFFISAHPMDAYTGEIERWTSITDTEMEDLPNEFYVVGFVAGCHETVIKKEGRNKGKTMAFITVETEFKSYEATLFPGVYESCAPFIKTGNAVVLKGKRNMYKDAVAIQGIYMRNITNSGIRDCPECHIRVKDRTRLGELRIMMDEHPGMTQVFLHIADGRYDLSIACGMAIALNDRIIDFVDTEIGQVSYKPI